MVATPALIATTCTSSRVVAPRRRPSVTRYSQWSPTTKRGGAIFSPSGCAAQAPRTSTPSAAKRRDSRSDRRVVGMENPPRNVGRDGSRLTALSTIGNRAETRGRDQLHVLGEQAARVARRRSFPLRAPPVELAVVDVKLNESAVRVDGNRVTLMHQRDRAADVGFRCHVTDDHAPRSAGKTAVGDKADAFAQALTDQRRRWRQHFLHSGTAFRPLVANHHHIARLNVLGHDRIERGGLGVEHARRARDRVILEALDLGHATLGREIAFQNRKVALAVHRLVPRTYDLLICPRVLVDAVELLAHSFAGDGDAVAAAEGVRPAPL